MKLYIAILLLLTTTSLADETHGEIECETKSRGVVVYRYNIPPSYKDLLFFKNEAAPAMYSDVDRRVCLQAINQSLTAISHGDIHVPFTWYVFMHDLSRACCL